LAVLLATLAKVDISALLIAGVIPGLILAGFYLITIFIQTRRDPSAAPPYEVEPVSAMEKLILVLRDVVPMVGLMAGHRGDDAKWHRHPSEAAAFGALGVLVLAAVFRALTLKALVASVTGALRVTLMAYLIVFGSATFSQFWPFQGRRAG
jgi:TRAP-type mannitol/chloroaromatic compound transport system permease large subunit